MFFRVAVAMVAALALAGCYVSKTPFITPVTADYPFTGGTRFAIYAPAGKQWLRRGTRTIRRAGAWYVYQDEGRPKSSLPFLVKRVAPGVLVVQMSDRPYPQPATEYTYQLIETDGATFIQYSGICPARPEWAARKLVIRIEETQTRRCIFSDFKSLVTVLREAAKNAAPEAKYVRPHPL
jgi:hypothetical protein